MKYMVILLLFSSLYSQNDTIKVSGEYTYTFGDSETLIDAKSLCYNMAVRNAIETYKIFIKSTSTVKNYKLVDDLIQTISSGYLQEIKILDESITGRTIHYKIEAKVNPIEIQTVLVREINKSQNENNFKGVIKGKFIDILSVTPGIKDGERTVNIVYKKTSNLSEFNLYGSKQDAIMIDYFNELGEPIGGNKAGTLYNLSKGETRSMYFVLPENVKSYKVWVTE